MKYANVKTRRDFLRGFVKLGFAFLVLLFGSVSLRFLYPARIRKRSIHFFYILKEEELPKQGVKKVNMSYEKDQKKLTARIFVVNHSGRLYALSSTCSHLGCLVDWSRHKEQFLCPCHGGKYDIEGRVIDGPPPLPLAKMPLQIEDGMVYIGLAI